MDLRAYLSARKLTMHEFGAQIGVGQQAVSAYVRKTRRPHRDVMLRIVKVTDGAVRPDDFYLPAAS